jgi:thiol peroxidase
MKKSISCDGISLSLVGRNINIFEQAPDFLAVNNDSQKIGLSSFKDKIKVIAFFLSLDTPVCDIQVREFNKRAKDLSDDVEVIGISKDLPYAQKRFCETFNIKDVTLISDYQYSFFGINFGVLIKEWNLLSRGVIIIDKRNTVRYFQIVSDIVNQPDYEEIIRQIDAVIKNPEVQASGKGLYKCVPYEGDVPPLPGDIINTMMSEHSGWELLDGKKIVKTFLLKNFIDAKYALDLLSLIAEEQGHHPSFVLNYNRLKITLTTHAAGGLTENDFVMARIINEVLE